ncbi:MAG: hypothetical protein WBB98_03965 [Xanthobacteraceae bacterium]
MNILTAIWPKAKKITSEAIAAEITRAEADLAATNEKLTRVFDGLAVMSDEQHAEAEDKATTLRRYGERLQARIDALCVERDAALAVEAEAAKVAAETARQKRVEAARHAVEIEGEELLRSYDRHANEIASIMARIAEINAEAQECRVRNVDQVHRTIPEQAATERREMAPHFIYRDVAPQPDEAHPGEIETVVRATLDSITGKPIPPAGAHYGRFGQVIQPVLELREVVHHVGGRRAIHAPSLSDVRLPPAFTGTSYIWPRP